MVGGWDVLVFFDFCSVPQEGVDQDGNAIPRPMSDQHVFDECLPNMGALYSVFHVLVLTKTLDGYTHSLGHLVWNYVLYL